MDYNYRPPYGASAYGQSTYGNPPPNPGYGYQPPVDPFRSYYASRLAQLTFNSRPIIQDLSLIAMQQREAGNWPNMQAVVEEIENAVLRASPQSKLPLLYLLDSISKNVGAPYTTVILPPIIGRLYQKTYREVDGVTRSKMEEMINLWRTGGPNHSELYGAEVRHAIEREIYGAAGAAARQHQQPLFTRDRVLHTLHTTLDQKQRECAAKPWDPTPRHQVGVLQQIANLLATQNAPPHELQSIMEQLKSMTAPPVPTPQPTFTPPYGKPSTANPANPALPPFPPPLRDSQAAPPYPPFSAPVVGTPVPPPTSTPLPAPVPLAAAIPANVADILRNLNNSGLISNPRTPDNAEAPGKNQLAAYEEMIIGLNLRLEALDLNRMKALPTSHLPVRCKQCGIRFPDGENKMQEHLDWHFRRNKSKSDTAGRGAHRRWLPKAEAWVNDFANAEAGPSAQTQSPSTSVAKLSADQLARYASRTVRVPSDPIKAGKPCPICKEPFKAELEDDEWIWRNAIEINGQIYHATCRAEQMIARKNAKMLNPNGRLSASKSPGLTPQPGEEVKQEVVTHEPSRMNNGATLVETTESHDEGLNAAKKRKVEGEGDDESKRVKVEEDVQGETEIPQHANESGAENDQGEATTSLKEVGTVETAEAKDSTEGLRMAEAMQMAIGQVQAEQPSANTPSEGIPGLGSL